MPLTHHIPSTLISKPCRSLSSSSSCKSLTPIKKLSQEYLQESSRHLHRLQTDTLKRNHSAYIKYKFTYQSPLHSTIKNVRKPIENSYRVSSFNINQQDCCHAAATPPKNKRQQQKEELSKKVKKLSELRNKIINNLSDARTIQSKYDNTLSPILKIQQSQLIFKGTKDVKSIIPTKLTYENETSTQKIKYNKDKELSQTKHESSAKNSTSPQKKKYFYNIRKTDKNKYIVRDLSIFGIFSIFQNSNNDYIVCKQLNHPHIIDVYHQVSSSIYIIEPYEYSLKELIIMGKTNPDSMAKITKQLNAVRQFLEEQLHRSIEMGTLCEIVYYVHGTIKILPLIKIVQ